MNDTIKALGTITGHEFADTETAMLALTHSSYAKEHWAKGRDNERLEFLGDAVLELAVSRWLFDNCPCMPEGDMSFSRQRLVRAESLYAAAKSIGLEKLIRMASSTEKTGGRENVSIVSDAFEAVIAAIYLDGGYEEAASFIERTVLSSVKETGALKQKDAKSELQETAAKLHMGSVCYELLSEEGPDSNNVITFTVRVLVDGQERGTGTGTSKKAAEQLAASQALESFHS